MYLLYYILYMHIVDKLLLHFVLKIFYNCFIE